MFLSVPVDIILIFSRLGWWFHTCLYSGWWLYFCSDAAPNGATSINRYGIVQIRAGPLWQFFSFTVCVAAGICPMCLFIIHLA